MHIKFITSILLSCFTLFGFGQNIPAYKNASLPINERVKDLLSKMTAEEKFWQLYMIPGDLNNALSNQYKNGLFGFQVSANTKTDGATQQLLSYNTSESTIALANKINAIQKYFVEQTRLGIPIIAFDEALHGLVRQNATSFPQAIGLAASFDTHLMSQVATAIALETKQRGIRQILSPVINIASDVRWGRVEETYGEDPYLTAEMAKAYITSFEQQGIITTPKHFLANVGDGGRDSYPIHYSDRLLKEIYLPPFKMAIESGAGSIMTSYNSIDGSPATASRKYLQEVLKKDFGFNGFVISDASAVGGANVLHYTAKDYEDAGKNAIENGLDVIFQTQYNHHQLFIKPFLDGSINKQRIDDAVTRVLTAKFKLGLFENPYVTIDTNYIQQQQTHQQLAKEAAAKSLVLLQNKNNVLPLHQNIKSIAVIGQDATEARLGGYSGPGNSVVSILNGLKNYCNNAIKLTYTKGVSRADTNFIAIDKKYLYIDKTLKQNGLNGAYYNNVSFSGVGTKQTDAVVDFKWTLYGPDVLKVNSFYSVQWKGYLQSPVTGRYKIGLQGNDGFRLYINDSLVINEWSKQSWQTNVIDFDFKKDKTYKIQIDFYEPAGNGEIKLLWNVGVTNDWISQINQAVKFTKQADVAIIVAGINEGEFQDRAILSLPGKQEDLINEVAKVGKPTIVLLTGGSAIIMNNWKNKVSSIVQNWYAGESGGTAIAEMLFGKTNPAGRLPITFPLHEGQLPLVYNHKPTGRGDDYNNLSGQPLFPFGFGLSYTTFTYDSLKIVSSQIGLNDSLLVQCTIKNTGKIAGDEVVQLYIHDELASVARPVTELKAFQRIHLKPQESKTVLFTLSPDVFKMYNEQMQWVNEPGDFKIMIGASSKDIRLQKIITIK